MESTASTSGRLECMPAEHILLISNKLESVDVLRLGCTCKSLAEILLSDNLWERACRQRWHAVAPFPQIAPHLWNFKSLFFRRNGWAGTALQRGVVQRFKNFHAMASDYKPGTGTLQRCATCFRCSCACAG
jgi:hypothetical protein